MVDRDTRLRLYGTDEPMGTSRRLVAGALTLEVANGAVRHLCWNGVEILRAIDFPVRNSNWGTVPTHNNAEVFEVATTHFSYRRRFTVGDSLFSGHFTCFGTASGSITAALRLHAERETSVNRAGFVILHPLAGVAGSPLLVTHGDGTTEETEFPRQISPSQPVFDIAALHHEANGVLADIRFAGETFEMEDQRNWSDASYKTYCRPLAMPYPFTIAAGQTVEQTIGITLSGSSVSARASVGNAIALGSLTGRNLPQLALALEAGWELDPTSRRLVNASATLLRIDLTAPNWPQILPRLLAASIGAVDLELIVSDTLTELDAELRALAATGVSLSSVIVLPKAWLMSYQPDGTWPAGVSPEQAAEVARQHFPRARIGGGVLTNFTELNRYRAAAGAGDFVTHGTSAIIHAADDLSVLQTLEALPQVFASAEMLAQERPYRLGLVSIGMRSNPYGAEVDANREGVRRPMAMNDPRQRGLFAAAWMVGAMAATEASRAQRLALAAPAGPFGLLDGAQARPAYHVHEALVRMGTAKRLSVSAPVGVAVVAVEGAAVIANLGEGQREIQLPQGSRIVLLDELQPSPNWLRSASRDRTDTLVLPAYAIAFLPIGPDDLFGWAP